MGKNDCAIQERCLLRNQRSDDQVYGITPDEPRTWFGKAEGWTVAFAYETVFECRWSANQVYFMGIRRD